ncbi:MAG: putative sulfate exporter family transporter [Devosia nanyangense]|uniref:Sulfate exporter family transporter n=1 Tax=Devosia nanyangense TaxID=1228055 RepID=A0A933P0V3_9HYPH|nr:putative sulfate exporter family transporter [Devosia nanyangense]
MSDDAQPQPVLQPVLRQSRASALWAVGTTRFPGVVVAVTVAIAAMFLSEHYGAPVMLFALLLGLALNFLSEPTAKTAAGIQYSSKTLLRLAVGLLGAQITLTQIMQLGLAPVILVIAAVLLTIGFGVVAARLFGLSREFGLLTAGAVAICGASAAMAIATVLPRGPEHDRDTVFTVVAVTTLSTVAMIVYPIIIAVFHLDHTAVGIFLGGTIHDVAQVVGAGFSVSEETGNVATFTKLLRVAMLLPVVFGLSFLFRGKAGPGSTKGTFPSFLILFAALVLLNSLGVIPAPIIEFIKTASRWLLVIAIAALGVRTSIKQMLSVGGRAIGLMVAETLFLAGLVLGAVLLGV